MRKAYLMLLVGFLVFNVRAQNQEHKAYHNNGKIKESGFLDENGEKTGEWKYYDATVGVGSLSEIGSFLNGKKTGEWKRFYGNGQLREIGSYEKNNPIREWETYHKDGRLKGSIIFANGLPKEVNEYYEDESIKSQIQYEEEDKQITRNIKNFYKNGQVESVGYDDGYYKIGEWKTYYKNGQLKGFGSYSSNEIATGRKVGEWKTYNEDGQLKPIENYLNGLVESPLSQEVYNSKFVFQADKSLIGKWYGIENVTNLHNFDYWEFKEDGTFTFYGGQRYSDGGNDYSGEYKLDSSKFPIVMEYTRDSYPRKNYLVFLSENEIRVLDNMSNTLKGGPIFTRVIVGEKNFLDFKMPKRTSYLPTTSRKILDKELKNFWENSIKNSLDINSRKKLYYWQHGINGRQLIYPTSNKELREGLQDMNYKDIEQVQLDDGEVLLMVYFLGKKHFQDVREENKNYEGLSNVRTSGVISKVKARSIHYGLLFKKGSDGWKLINTLTSSDYKGGRDITLEAIKSNQNELINQGVFNIELRSFVNQSLPAFINLETDKIVAQTNFPLKGNWGIAFGLPVNASTWKKSDFEANITKLINEDDRNILSESYNNGWIHAEGRASIDYFREYGTNEEPSKNISLVPLIFTLEHLNGKLEVDGIKYNSSTELKFQKIDGNWKLIEMNIERRPTE